MTWLTPDEVVSYGFAVSPVVMMNEAHSGMSRCLRTRRVGREILPAAHDSGCRHLAMEALPNRGDGSAMLAASPEVGYLTQPEMRELVEAALALGWTLVAYEIGHRDEGLTMEATNRRELVQAENLVDAWHQIRKSPMLVWCGNSHHATVAAADWTPMGVRFIELAGFRHFSIDQTETVLFDGTRRPNIELTDPLRATLDARGGTAGFVSSDPPPGLAVPEHHDALILSTDNEMIE